MKDINAFIPAAGLGERLRPISAQIPKPLLPVLGRPVVEMVLEKVCALPIGQIGMNIHYHPETLREYVARSAYSKKITLFHEKEIMGTGGALRNASSLLGKSGFLVHNADIISAIDLASLLDSHVSSGNIATLAVHDYPLINTVWIDMAGRVRHVGRHDPEPGEVLRPVTYTGVAVYSSAFLRFIGEGKCSVVDAWLKAASSGPVVGTLDVTGVYWSDIGTPGAYSSAVFHALNEAGEASYIHPSVECDRLDIGGLTVIEEGTAFEGAASLRNCIILPGSKVAREERIENAITGRLFRLTIKENFSKHLKPPSALLSGILPGPPGKIRSTLIGTGGSDRRYYRLRNHEKTVVLLECMRSDPDYRRQIAYTRFFEEHSIPVPALMAEEPAGLSAPDMNSHVHAIFEDLGDLSLYSWKKCIRQPSRVENLYRKSLDLLVKLHTIAPDKDGKSPLPNFRIFDYDHLRWETNYFLENFVRDQRGISPDNAALLDEELGRLARKVDSFPKTVIHRDFQSQNIMVTGGDIPRIIDYQGARIGPPAYDLVSLLWDPYARLDDLMRQRLIVYYIEKIRDHYGHTFEEPAFIETLIPCSLQRHMQALGAYGFLAGRKGKKYFLKHVPLGLSYLHEEAEQARSEYPELYRLVSKL